MSVTCSPLPIIAGCKSTERFVADSSDLKILWSKSNVSVYDDPFNPLLQGVKSIVFAVIQSPDYSSSKIIALDTLSGNLLWESKVVLPATIVTSDSSLYMGIYDKIQEYDAFTGRLVKEATFPNVGAIYNIFYNQQSLFALTNSGRWLTYDVKQNTSELSEPFLPYTPFIVDNEILYSYDPEGIKATAIQSKVNLWKYPIAEAINIHPLFTDTMLIILSQTGSIYALNKENGNLIWKSDKNVISNIATDASQLYFLTSDGYLNVVGISNGQEIQRVEVSPTGFEVNPAIEP